MNRYRQIFQQASQQKRGILVPFLMLGDGSLEQILAWVDMLVENGADALELGMPFSDPVADGPVIQAATIRALQAGTTPDSCFDIISQIRTKYPDLAMGLLTYANLVVARGLGEFYNDAQKAGLDSILIADIPVHAILPFKTEAEKTAVDVVLIATPNATEKQLQSIACHSTGYTYVVSRSGVTGADKKSGIPKDIISQLTELNAAPALLGFGISTEQDVRDAIQAGCSGAICGSALVSIQQKFNGTERLEKGAQLMNELTSGLTY